ncbi:MAG: FAD-binding oxidoreductase [Kofleriaceae bacterium]
MPESGRDVDAVTRALVDLVGRDHVTAPTPGATTPVWRVAPGSVVEIAGLVRAAPGLGVVVAPAGSGRRPPVHARPTVQTSMARLCHVLALDERSLTAHVQVGLTGVDLEAQLVPRGLSLGDYPPAVMRSTLGGIVAVRTHGKSSARTGFFEDNVLGVSAVLADGRTIHTRIAPRRATGPDLARALCGSEGAIGILTSLVLRLHRAPEARFATAYALPSVAAAVAAVQLALREEAAPSGVRIYDEAEARVHFAELDLALGDGEALLVAGTAGPTDLAACDRDLVSSAAIAEGGRLASPALAELWWRRIHGGAPTPAPTPTTQLMATPGRLVRVYGAIAAAAAEAGLALRAHVSRFDADGAVVFVTLVRGGAVLAETDPGAVAVVLAAEGAGAFPLGARSLRLDGYLAALRTAIDPDGVLSPEALT